ncbi:DUF6477 family protein [Tropicibacter alexandrii]|uniref:DUF6477 family protein n=1 Tax=Tropicibacter alexandrii TaxID=2267683 RepID=UPI000EF53172|nr:DUF6477 family protein [Tropicibacter alexandrii]
MKDLLGLLNDLRRPRLLIRAARAGVEDYDRDMHLPRILGGGAMLRPGPALIKLMELEAEFDEARRREDATYTVRRHVELLVAMMGEARQLRLQRYDQT